MYKTLEHNEHAGHIAHGHDHAEGEGDHGHGPAAHGKATRVSPNLAALLVASLAATLALAEQGAKHAEIKVQQNLISATDAWAQFQAKSTRATISKDMIGVIAALEPTSSPDVADRRNRTIAELKADQERYEADPKDGKEAITHRAHDFEHARDHALEQTHAYHNGAAALELGIVLSTASAIIGSRLLLGLALLMGLGGAAAAIAGFVAPEWGAF